MLFDLSLVAFHPCMILVYHKQDRDGRDYRIIEKMEGVER